MSSDPNSDVLTFERGRIQALRQERISVQQKTFTKWVNSYLGKANCHIDDVFKDFEDGCLLLKLLELISGEKMGRPKPARMRVQKVENVNKALQFLSTKVRLESIGPEDIVDGNPRLILGLMWTIILRFEIQEIKIEGIDSAEIRSAKEALLLWCQRQTASYNDVNIKNFSSSWRSGTALCALIHTHRPDLIDYPSLQTMTNIERLNAAFDVAHEHLGISKLLDAEDVDIDRPDEKSIITYIIAFYHYFAKMKSGETGKKRIVKILSKLQELQDSISSYEKLVTDLLEWITSNTKQLSNHNFLNSLAGIKEEMANFKLFRTEEKPPKYKVWTEIEAIWFEIHNKVRDNRCRSYTPPENGSIHNIERAWVELEKEEYRREVAIREELIKQERLHRLAENFERKALLRESWIADISTVLQESVIPQGDVKLLEACIKRHEAITADIMARQERFEVLAQMAQELISQNYEESVSVSQRNKDIAIEWQELMDLVSQRQRSLESMSDLIGLLREIDAITADMEAVQISLQSTDYGKHVLSVEGLLERHALTEVQVKGQGSQIGHILQEANTYIDADHGETKMIEGRTAELTERYQRIQRLSAHRRNHLEASLNYFKFLQEENEIEAWIAEKQRLTKSKVTGRDVRGVLMLRQKHSILETEIQGGDAMVASVTEMGTKLIESGHPSQKTIEAKLSVLQSKMKTLKASCAGRRDGLEEALEAHQYFIDVNEADSWMRERLPMVCSDDHGNDATSAQQLKQRHQTLEEEIQAHENDIKKLGDQAQCLVSRYQPSQNQESSTGEDDTRDGALPQLPGLLEEKSKVEDLEEDVIEERKCPQVKALYKYEAYGMKIPKGGVMLLVSKSNTDWWEIKCSSSGQQGFIPANYVKEVAPKIIKKKVRKKVERSVTSDENGNNAERSDKARDSSLATKEHGGIVDYESILSRQRAVESTYVRLKKLARARRMYLVDSVKLFTFYRECDEFEAWMSTKEKSMSKKERMSDKVDAARRQFENLVTDLQANRGRFERINQMADDFVSKGHSKQVEARQRQTEIRVQWERIGKMRGDKEKMMEGVSSIELYNQSWGEAKEWISEKVTAVTENYLTSGTPSEEYLERKLESIEQEIKPVREKLQRLGILATAVKSSYPAEVSHIKDCESEIRDHWQALDQQLLDKKTELLQARDVAVFEDKTKELMDWTVIVRTRLLDTHTARDIQGCEDMMNEHLELLADIQTRQQRFSAALALAGKISDRESIQGKVQMLSEVPSQLLENWDKRNRQLENSLDLAMFNKEADQIDADSTGHETFLAYDELGASVCEIDAIQKRHDSFLASLDVQENKLIALREMSGNLIQKGHSSRNYIQSRVDSVVERRRAVRDGAERRSKLINSRKSFLHFTREVEEVTSWIGEKVLIAQDDSYKDLSCLPSKLKEHQMFEVELSSHSAAIKQLREAGKNLIDTRNPSSNDIRSLLDEIQSSWKQLAELTNKKGTKLHQAAQLVEHNRGLDDVSMMLDEIDGQLETEDVGDGLKSVKNLIKRHELLKKSCASAGERLEMLEAKASLYRCDGHLNSQEITNGTKAVSERFASVTQPMNERERILKEALEGQEFKVRVDSELQWIKERLPAVWSTDTGSDYRAAQRMLKKYEKLRSELTNRDAIVADILKEGESLVIVKHPLSCDIKESCDGLKVAYQELVQLTNSRNEQMEMNFRAQQYLLDATEVELWCSEKLESNFGHDLGRDEIATKKLLAKSKALEEDLACQEVVIDALQKKAHQIIQENNPDAAIVAEKQGRLDRQLIEVANRVSEWRGRLELTQLAHRYSRDSDELGDWIEEKYQLATSGDYGQDYEHMQMLWDKFVIFKGQMVTGADMCHDCEEQVKILMKRGHPEVKQIRKKQDSLEQAFKMLMEKVATREQRLLATTEMHQFRFLFEDVSSRILEKQASLPEDHGKGVDSVQSLIRKHDTFTTDVIALNSQLESLLNQAADLDERYPGMFSDELMEKRETVSAQWKDLHHRAKERGQNQQKDLDYQTFIASYQELENWAQEMETAMGVTETITSIAGAVAAIQKHEELRMEVTARKDSFTSLMESGRNLMEQQHHGQLEEKLDKLSTTREDLLRHWEAKEEELTHVHAEHVFMRDVEQLYTASSQQEVLVTSANYGDTVEEVERAERKQDAFDKLLMAQEEKVSAIIKQQDAFKTSKRANEKLSELVQRRDHIKQQNTERRKELNLAKLYAQFKSNMAEARELLTEKEIMLESHGSYSSSPLQDGMKRSKKHQAFESELAASEALIKDTNEIASQLEGMNHANMSNIRQDISDLNIRWTGLRDLPRKSEQSLQKRRRLMEFQRQAERIDLWMRDKSTLVSFGDVSDDYEHCLQLQEQLHHFGQNKSVDDRSVSALCDLAVDIDQEGAEGFPGGVLTKAGEIKEKWYLLQGDLSDYEERLNEALEIHSFHREIQEFQERIIEKGGFLNSGDVGTTLVTIEQQKRRYENDLKEMEILEAAFRRISESGRTLADNFQAHRAAITSSLMGVSDQWRLLQASLKDRGWRLEQAYHVHIFMEGYKNLIDWSETVISTMSSAPLANSTINTDQMCADHQKLWDEVEVKEQDSIDLGASGQRMIDAGHPSAEELTDALAALEETREEVMGAWQERKRMLDKYQDLQVFQKSVKAAESVLSNTRAFLADKPSLDNLSMAEDAVRKQDEFERLLTPQLDILNEVTALGAKLSENDHYEKESIGTTIGQIKERKNKLLTEIEEQRSLLQDSVSLYQFLQSIREFTSWIEERSAHLVSGRSYGDLTILRSKVTKHQSQQLEVSARQNKLLQLQEEGQRMVEVNHCSSEKIKEAVANMVESWDKLCTAMKVKGRKLQEAYQLLTFERNLQDMEQRLNQTKDQLTSDYGEDLRTATCLLKKHKILENQLNLHKSKVDAAPEKGWKLTSNDTTAVVLIRNRLSTCKAIYKDLCDLSKIRLSNLKNSVCFYQLLNDMREEAIWIEGKLPSAQSADYGSDVSSVSALCRKHKSLLQDISAHKPLIEDVINKASSMVNGDHYTAEQISDHRDALNKKWEELNEAAQKRETLLQMSYKLKMYFLHAAEALTWLDQRMPSLREEGKVLTEEMVLSLLRRLMSLQVDLDMFSKNTLENLRSQSEELCIDQPKGADAVTDMQTKVEEAFNKLQSCCEEKQSNLLDQQTLFNFRHEVDNIIEWMREKMVPASSEEYGKDLEHLEILQGQFSEFVEELRAYEGEIHKLLESGQGLIDSGTGAVDRISEQCQQVDLEWRTLREAANCRSEALMKSRQLHSFNSDAQETISWIQEKNTALAMSDAATDLATTQALSRKHDILEHDLMAIEERVNQISSEAGDLVDKFPDAFDHVSNLNDRIVDSWNNLLEKSVTRKNLLQETERLLLYLKDYKNLSTQISSMRSCLDTSEIPNELPGLEEAISTHSNHRREIEAWGRNVSKFITDGEALIEEMPSSAEQVKDKMKDAEQQWKDAQIKWAELQTMYNDMQDKLILLRDLEQAEQWLEERQGGLLGDHMDKACNIDELLKKQDELEKLLAHQEMRFLSLGGDM